MRDCENCKHRVMKVEVGKGASPEHFWGCECWECEFEPTTKNDLGVDCISRQEVLRLLANSIGKTNTYLQTEVLKMSSVTPQEPKTGEWIENASEYQNIDPPYICSECGNMHLRKTNYCDQCGCRMVEPQESEDEE